MILRKGKDMKNNKIWSILFVLVFLFFSQTFAGGGEGNPGLDTNAKALKEWQDKKFGMFIHWDPVSLRGTEIGWSRGREVPIEEYDNLYKEFNPVHFDAQEWVNIAKAAGMKYIVITSKHHDGFCIWDSEYTDYDMMSTPFKRDILQELSDECRRQGILFGTYHSLCDWHHPDYTTRYGGDPRPIKDSDMEQYVVYLKNQIKELVEKYDTKILWFDGEWENSWTHELGMDLYKYVRELGDDILINNRVDKGRGGMEGMTVAKKFAGDFGTPEQEIGAFFVDSPWESCITICRQWAWKPNDKLKSLRECIHTLARSVGGGGNLLLNVGPMLDGRIEQRQIDRLEEIGEWLDINGESVYSTKAGPYKPNDWMASTHLENKIYFHLFQWPKGPLKVPGLKSLKVRSAYVLGGTELEMKQSKDIVSIKLPKGPIDKNDTVIVLELDTDVTTLKPMEMPQHDLVGIANARIRLKSPPSDKYPGFGIHSLVDGVRGSLSLSDGNWLGFEQVDFDAKIDLTKEGPVDNIQVTFLQNQNSLAFLPTSVEFFVSKNGKEYTLAKTTELGGVEKDPKVFLKTITAELKTQGRYLEIRAKNVGTCPKWHKRSGRKACLFVDEILINP
jgi:alpha-L-fucosidase